MMTLKLCFNYRINSVRKSFNCRTAGISRYFNCATVILPPSDWDPATLASVFDYKLDTTASTSLTARAMRNLSKSSTRVIY
jgi:hypothetical protein